MSTLKKSLILLAHGAREPGWAKPFHRLRELLWAEGLAAELAFLEWMTPTLPQLAAQQIAEGAGQLVIVPLFLGQAGHVQRDVPVLIEQLRLAYPGTVFQLAGAAGEDAGVLQALARYCMAQA